MAQQRRKADPKGFFTGSDTSQASQGDHRGPLRDYKTYVRNEPEWSVLTEGSRYALPAPERARVQGLARLRHIEDFGPDRYVLVDRHERPH